jgi:hypothetical protein
MLREKLNLVIVFVLLVLQGTLSLGRVQAAPTSSVAPLAATSGTVVAWGCSSGYDSGQCTVPEGLSDVTAIAAGGWHIESHSLALKSDGTVVAWGSNSYGETTVPAGLNGVTAISAGVYHNLALKSDGTVVAWGFNGDGAATVPGGLTGVTAIAAGGWHSMALKGDGTVVAWGRGVEGQTSVPEGLSDVTAIAAGWWHGLALKSDGTVVAWGCGIYQDWGQCTVPAGLNDVTAIAAGGYFGGSHSLALKSDGTVVAWGASTVPAELSGVTAIAASNSHSLALKSDSTVVAWGANFAGETTVPEGLTGVTAIAAGSYNSLAIVNVPPTNTPTPTATPSSTATSGSCMLPPAGLVSWWPGDGNADDIIGSHNGTLVGGVAFTAGEVGQAFSFDGIDDIVLAPATGFPMGTASRTVAFWSKISPSDDTSTGFAYGAEMVGKGFYVFASHSVNGGRLTFSGHGSEYNVLAPTDFRDGLYHHIVVTYDGTLLTIYSDGIPVASGSLSLDTGISGGASIGGRGYMGEFLTGAVDEVALWDRVLSASDIQAMFSAGSAGMCKNLTDTPTPTNTPTDTPTSTDTPTDTPTPTNTPTFTPTPTNTPTNTPTPTDTPTPTSTSTPTATPTNVPPTISVVSGGVCASSGGNMNLTVGDANGDPLNLSGTSSNTSVVPNSNIIFGGSGTNRTITITAVAASTVRNATITVNVSDGSDTTPVTIMVVVGTNGTNSALNGTAGANLILGLGGNDTINGLDGNDLLCGGSGKDTINGGAGHDSMFGADGNDSLTGGADADFFSGGIGKDTATDFNAGQGDTQDGMIP